MTEMYSSLLSNMWAPEGSEINERLQNLQRLENMRKEREAMWQKNDNSSGSRRTRLGASTYQSRRARTTRGSNEDLTLGDFGGARPKLTNYSNGDKYSSSSWFSDSTRSAVAPRSRLGSTGSEGSHFETTNNYDFSLGSSNLGSFGRSFSKPEGNSDGNIFAGIAESVFDEARKKRYNPNYNISNSSISNNGYSSSRRQRKFDRDNLYNSDEPDFGQSSHFEQNQHEADQDQVNDDQLHSEDGETVHYIEEHHEIQDDPEEEPVHFIERLKQGNQTEYFDTGYKRTAPHTINVNPIPSVPPLKRARNSNEDELGDKSQSEEDIVALAKNIHATFGIKSPKIPEAQPKKETFSFSGSQNGQNNTQNGDLVFTAKSSVTTPPKRSPKRKSTSNRKERKLSSENKNNHGFTETGDNGEFEIYEIHEIQYNSEEDDERIPLEIDTRSSFYQKTADGRLHIGQSPGKIDNIHEFFCGTSISEDPEITRELNGSMVKAEMENEPGDSPNILANVKSALNNLVDFSNDANTSDKVKREIMNKPVRKVRNEKISDSDSDSCTTSEGGNRGSRTSSPAQRKENKKLSTGSTKASTLSEKRKSPLTIDDKLKKLETMTQEKTRKQSIGENDEKRPIPSYMSPTNASQKKTAKGKDSPMTDIVKDVRELKRFVQENVSEPNTPVRGLSTAKEFKSPQKIKKVMQETSTQTDRNYEIDDDIYICKHCGKSNKDPVDQDTKSLTDHGKSVHQIEKGSSSESNTDYRGMKHQTKATPSSDKGKTNSEKSNQGKNEERQSLKTSSNINKTKWESKSEKGFPMHVPLYEKRTTPELRRSNSKESVNSMSDGSVLDEKRTTKSKSSAVSRGYMKGTTSSILKNTNGTSNEKKRKASAPDIHKTKGEDTPKFAGMGLVAQRAKGFETFSKANSRKTKAGLSVYRGKSAERQTERDIRPVSPEEPVSPRLAKSKSVDEVHLIKNKMLTAVDDTKNHKVKNEAEIMPDESKVQPQVIKKSAPPPISKKPMRIKPEAISAEKTQEKSDTDRIESRQQEAEKLQPTFTSDDIQADVKPGTEINECKESSVTNSDKEVLKKEDNNDVTVDSKGQFLTLEQNPFIKNDVQRKNSFKGCERESVWVKESRSRDSSLKRSNSFEGDKQQLDSTLSRSNTSVGERTSLTQLSWSDSGSNGSLTSSQSQRGEKFTKSGSHSSLHGSYTDLYKDSTEQQQKVRSGSVSSATSQTSQNSMLNLLNSPSSKRNVVTGAVETDVDAAYTEYLKSQNGSQREVHDEASVERSHLDFAKKACDLLEFQMKTRDSSSDSQGNEYKNGDGIKAGNVVNGNANERHTDIKAVEINNSKNSAKTNNNTDKQGKKGKKSFLKGKLFKK